MIVRPRACRAAPSAKFPARRIDRSTSSPALRNRSSCSPASFSSSARIGEGSSSAPVDSRSPAVPCASPSPSASVTHVPLRIASRRRRASFESRTMSSVARSRSSTVRLVSADTRSIATKAARPASVGGFPFRPVPQHQLAISRRRSTHWARGSANASLRVFRSLRRPWWNGPTSSSARTGRRDAHSPVRHGRILDEPIGGAKARRVGEPDLEDHAITDRTCPRFDLGGRVFVQQSLPARGAHIAARRTRRQRELGYITEAAGARSGVMSPARTFPGEEPG